MKRFLVNPEDGTINLHYDILKISEVAELIKLLEANAQMLKRKITRPLDIFRQTARLNRLTQEVSFQFTWSGFIYRASLNEGIPMPDPDEVQLTEAETKEYSETIRQMLNF